MNNGGLVDRLKREGYLSTPTAEKAFRSVDRALFVLENLRESAYDDTPLPIGHGQTISAPSIVAVMTEALKVKKGMKVLEVGTGSGYQAAILARMGARVFGIEKVAELKRTAGKAIRRAVPNAEVNLFVGDGAEGLPEHTPFDRIIITAATPSFPAPLVGQLAEGGIIEAPLGGRWRQDLVVATKRGGELDGRATLPVIFVPLTGRHGFSP